MLSGVMPPTGNKRVGVGNTARRALTACGVISSAGNNLSPCAPAASAAKASVGVITPGRQTMSRLSASRTCCTVSTDKRFAGRDAALGLGKLVALGECSTGDEHHALLGVQRLRTLKAVCSRPGFAARQSPKHSLNTSAKPRAVRTCPNQLPAAQVSWRIKTSRAARLPGSPAVAGSRRCTLQ